MDFDLKPESILDKSTRSDSQALGRPIRSLTSSTSSNPILINSFLKCNLKSRSSGLLIIAFISVIQATLSCSLLQISNPGKEINSL